MPLLLGFHLYIPAPQFALLENGLNKSPSKVFFYFQGEDKHIAYYCGSLYPQSSGLLETSGLATAKSRYPEETLPGIPESCKDLDSQV